MPMALAFGSLRQEDWVQEFESSLDNKAKCYLKNKFFCFVFKKEGMNTTNSIVKFKWIE